MAKKKSSKGSRGSKARRRAPERPEVSDAHQRRQERLDSRRQARAEAIAARRKAERRRRVVRIAVVTVLAAGLAWFVLVRSAPEPIPEAIRGHAIETFPDTGLNEHVTGTVEYDSVPPTHGPHAAQAAPCGVHSAPVPPETQVHSLEHGAVGIQYDPELDRADIRRIEEVTRSFDSNVFSAPYPGMPSAVTVTSWGELMRLDDVDVRAIRDYTEVFRGRGPEQGASCPNTIDDPFRPVSGGAGAGG